MNIFNKKITKIALLYTLMLPVYTLCSQAYQPDNQAEVIDLHGKVKQITSETSCEPAQWGNSQEDACRCSLIHNKSKFGSTKTDDEIILYTTNTTKRCNQNVISKIKTEQGLSANASSQQLLESLFSNNIVIQKMTIDTSQLSPTGTFTEKSLPTFLAKAFREKKLNNKDFSKEECIKAKNLGTQGGYNTLQLFLVTSTCDHTPASMYIIKEASNGLEEAMNLKTIEDYPGMKDIVAPKIVKGLPSLALPFAYFSYPQETPNAYPPKKIHYIAAMPSAKGKVLSSIIMEFRDNQSAANKETVGRAFKILGIESANFHKKNMKRQSGKILGTTIVHGDFHSFNLFFDPITGHFVWIDNETMAKYLHNLASPAVDFVKLFFMPFCLNETFKQFHDLVKGIDLKVWFDVTLKNFIEGYISAYKPTEKKQLLQELKTMFNEPFTIPWVDFENAKLQDIRTKYINPVFDALMK